MRDGRIEATRANGAAQALSSDPADANAAAMLAYLSETDAKQALSLVNRMNTLPGKLKESVSFAFLRAFNKRYGVTEVPRLLSHDLLDSDIPRWTGASGEIRENLEHIGIWNRISQVNDEALAGYLKNEFPQTVSLILTLITRSSASKVLKYFPRSLIDEALMRIMLMDSPHAEVLQCVEGVVLSEFIATFASSSRQDPYRVVADILNNLDSQTANQILDALKARDKDLAEKVQAGMFVFEDLARLNSQAIQVLIANVQRETLYLALKGASEQVKAYIMANVSVRMSKIFEDAIANLGRVRLKEVTEAQSLVVATARGLAQKGQIELHSTDTDVILE